MDYDKIMRETVEALKEPKTGDHYHEMFSYHMFVLEVTPATITFISASPPCSFPDDGKIETLSREDFIAKFCYNSIPDKAWVQLYGRGSDVKGWLSTTKS